MVGLTDRLDMTIIVDWDINPLIKQTNMMFKYFLTANEINKNMYIHSKHCELIIQITYRVR